MTAYVALLRAVNLMRTGRIAMSDLRTIAEDVGFGSPRTFIASGNLLFTSNQSEAQVRAALEKALAAHLGKPVAVMVRTAAEIADVAKANPFPDAPTNRVLAIFLSEPPPNDALNEARGREDERMALGKREIYVDYGTPGVGRSKLRIPAAAKGTARNMNSVARLAELARDLT